MFYLLLELIVNFRRRAKLRTSEKFIRLPSGLIHTGLFSKLLFGRVKLSQIDPNQPRSSCVGVEGEKQPGLDSHWQEEPPGCHHWNCRFHQLPHFHFHRHIWRHCHCHHYYPCVQVPQMFYPVETDLTLSAGDVVAARCTMVNTRNRWSWLFLGTLLNGVMLLYFRWLMFGEMFRTHDYIVTSYYWQHSLSLI